VGILAKFSRQSEQLLVLFETWPGNKATYQLAFDHKVAFGNRFDSTIFDDCYPFYFILAFLTRLIISGYWCAPPL
jgi:hypothetical protein